MTEGKVAAAIVTYNRLELLKQVLPAVMNQTRRPDLILVTNNSSTDGTTEWLAQQEGITVVTQPNVGSSGGQYTGIKSAYDMGYDWIWVMDDDVVPAPDALEKLLEKAEPSVVVSPLRFTSAGKPYHNDTLQFNMTNPFRSFWTEILSDKTLADTVIRATGITFEGPLFHRSLVGKIGLPRFDFFIYGDDSEYFIRADRNGFRIVVYTEARFTRLIDPPAGFRFDWKSYYTLRNQIAIDRLHGSLSVRLLRPLFYSTKWLLRCRSFSNVVTVLKGFFDGYFYRERIPEEYR